MGAMILLPATQATAFRPQAFDGENLRTVVTSLHSQRYDFVMTLN